MRAHMKPKHLLVALLSLMFPFIIGALAGVAPARPSATFAVDSTLDEPDASPGDGACASTPAGQCTLRAAIMEANAQAGPDTITLPPGTYSLTIAGTGENAALAGDLDITDSATISATGAIMDGGGIDRVFEILTGTIGVNISGVTIQNGRPGLSAYGGGILINSGAQLSLTGSSVISNTALYGGGLNNSGGMMALANSSVISGTASDGGGGIYNGGGGAVTLTNSSVIDSIAGAGGGILNDDGALTMTGSTIRHNSAFPISGGGGGGIFNGRGGTLIMIASTVLSNTSAFGSGGGGIFNDGGTLTLTGTSVSYNGVLAVSGFGGGGGIFNDSGGALAMIASSVLSNTSDNGFGGGIFNGDGSTLTVTTSAIAGNTTFSIGGGILNSGALTVITSTVVGNTAWSGGGGILSDGTLTLANSTVSGNSVTEGGGGILSDGTLTVANSTLSGNNAADGGGGVFVYGGLLNLNNVTLTNNAADSDSSGMGDGGGIYILAGTVNVTNTLVAGNSDYSPITSTLHPDASGTFISGGYNLVGVVTGTTGFTATGDMTNIAPLLGPLQDNGGPTLTHALLSGSAGIDAGNPAPPGTGGNACRATDQRGVARPQGSACDIGAFEAQVADPPEHRIYLPIVRRN